MAALTYFSPAKLNLFLHILGRRADGYHLLQMVFQLIDYGDEISFEKREDTEIKLNIDPDSAFLNIGDAENNLIIRAARLLQNETGVSCGANIHLHKKIPIGGGLGGGSSNAATTLIALNKLWQLHLSENQLATIGVSLGADVPVFIYGKTAWAEGIGDQLTSITLPEAWFVVLTPACSVPTAEIYSANELTRNTTAITIRDFLSGHSIHNDCETVVRKRYPIIDAALNWLEQFAPARLTGTGSCVFAAFKTENEAREILQKASGLFQGFVAKGINDIWGVAKR